MADLEHVCEASLIQDCCSKKTVVYNTHHVYLGSASNDSMCLKKRLRSKTNCVLTNQQPQQTKTSWSVLKQLMLTLRPTVLSCSVQASDVVASRMLDTKEKIRQANELEREIRDFITNESVKDRFIRLYSMDLDTGKDMPHLERMKSSIKMILFALYGVGFVTGYLKGSDEFMKANKATMFASAGQANKRRYNHMMLCGLRQGIKTGFQGGAVCITLFAIYQGLEVWFNKSTPISMATACGTIGCLSKIKIGPKAMFAGGIIGTTFGAMGGLAAVGLQKLAGQTQEQVNYELVKQMMLINKHFEKPNVPENYTEEVDNM